MSAYRELIYANAKFLYPTILERLEAKCTDKAAETANIDQQKTLSVLVITSAAEGENPCSLQGLAVRCAWRADKIHVIMRGAGSPTEEGALFFLLLDTAPRTYSVLQGRIREDIAIAKPVPEEWLGSFSWMEMVNLFLEI